MFGSDISWISVGLSVLGSVIGAGSILGAFLIAWGRIKNEVQNHEKRLDYSNGQLASQNAKDSSLEAELSAIKSRCESRDSLWRRNNDDHVEIFARINSLEKGHAAMPGQMAEMMDGRFEKWQEALEKMLTQNIKAAIYEIDSEKMKYRRRPKDGAKKHGDGQ